MLLSNIQWRQGHKCNQIPGVWTLYTRDHFDKDNWDRKVAFLRVF